MKAKKVKKVRVARDFQWCGVRFIHGDNLEKVYTYKVRRGVRLHLGQELVVRNHRGVSIVVVVAINESPGDWINSYGRDHVLHSPIQRRAEDMNWKWITETVSKL